MTPASLQIAKPSLSSLEQQFITALKSELDNHCNNVAKAIRTKMDDGMWGEQLAKYSANLVASVTMPATHTSLLAGKSMLKTKALEWLHTQIKEGIQKLGINPDNPRPNKPLLPEEELECTPPEEVDTAAVEFIDSVLNSTTDPPDWRGIPVLRRARAYLSNVDEIVDYFRLSQPGQTTYAYDSTI